MLTTKKIITGRRVAAIAAFTGAIVFSLVLLSWPNLRSYRQAAFVNSAHNGNVGTMKLLLALGANANELECPTDRCRTPLIAAVQGGQYEAVKLLISRGADVNKRMKRGQTALMFASYYGHTELVKLLLASGADVNTDFEGDTALSWAKQQGHAEIVSLLIATGATR
jgi:ankyrin repeat protein